MVPIQQLPVTGQGVERNETVLYKDNILIYDEIDQKRKLFQIVQVTKCRRGFPLVVRGLPGDSGSCLWVLKEE